MHAHNALKEKEKITRQRGLRGTRVVLPIFEHQGSRTHARGTAFENWRHPGDRIESHFTRKRRDDYYPRIAGRHTGHTVRGWRQLAREREPARLRLADFPRSTRPRQPFPPRRLEYFD